MMSLGRWIGVDHDYTILTQKMQAYSDNYLHKHAEIEATVHSEANSPAIPKNKCQHEHRAGNIFHLFVLVFWIQTLRLLNYLANI